MKMGKGNVIGCVSCTKVIQINVEFLWPSIIYTCALYAYFW